MTALGATLATPGHFLRAKSRSRLQLILAPSNLGLRPHANGEQQGAWQAPEVLMDAGLATALGGPDIVRIPRPEYARQAQPGTRILNGHAIKIHSLDLADHVAGALESQLFPVVIGGDCSLLLGCLAGARKRGGRGLIHVDGHSDFYHPGNYDTESRLGSAAGMDLALATGRGEKLLTRWNGISGPLVSDEDTFQVGDRDSRKPEYRHYYEDLSSTSITCLSIQELLNIGIESAARRIGAFMRKRELDKTWLHVDFDVLDQNIMPAVDSPGSPGLDFDQLTALLSSICETGNIAGATFTIYDPMLDPERKFAGPIAECIARSLRHYS